MARLHWAPDMADMTKTACGIPVYIVLEQGADVTPEDTMVFRTQERKACKDCIEILDEEADA